MGGISHGDKFGNLIGTCGRVAADKSDNVWHWHHACEWAMLKKNCRSLARGISHGDKFGNLICEWAMLKKKNCRSLARGISHGDKFGNLIWEWAMLKKKKLQKFGTGYFAR